MYPLPIINCEKCKVLINNEPSFDNLPKLEKSLPWEVKMTLVYIAGYVVRKSPVNDDTNRYLEEFGGYLKQLNRGGLTLPGDTICQWVVYSYILYHQINSHVCRTSLCNALMMIVDFYRFTGIKKQHGRILSNIINNYYHLYSPKSSKEPELKVLKLSNS